MDWNAAFAFIAGAIVALLVVTEGFDHLPAAAAALAATWWVLRLSDEQAR